MFFYIVSCVKGVPPSQTCNDAYHLAIYKILDKIISKDQHSVWVDLAYFASPFTQHWKNEVEWNESLKKPTEYDTMLN